MLPFSNDNNLQEKRDICKTRFLFSYGGAKESRTPDLLLARQAL